MRVRTVTVLLVVAALVVAIAAVIAGNSGGSGARLADSTNGRSTVEGGAGTESGPAGRSPGAATPTPGASNPSKSKTKSDKNKSDSGDPTSGQEGNPSASTPVPYRLPDSTPPDSTPEVKPKPLVSAPLPATANASGSIVKGFPAVIPQAPQSTITFSSVATQGERMQVGLDATTTVSAADLLAYYRTAFEPLGLVAAPAAAVEGSTALSFVRGDNGITVTVSTSAASPRSHYTVTGVFVAGT